MTTPRRFDDLDLDRLAALDRESARFRDVLRDLPPDTPVPSCPAWSAADLLWHLADVQLFWTAMIEDPRRTGADYEPPARPEEYGELVDLHARAQQRLTEVLAQAGADDPAWTWHHSDHSVGFVRRRQALEAVVHRVDAELAADQRTPIDPLLASDGVLEVLDVMFGGCPPWGTFTPGDGLLRIDATDTDRQVWVRLGRFTGTDPDDPDGGPRDEPDLHVVDPPTDDVEPDVVVAGPAEALLLWLWRRGTGPHDHPDLDVAGSPDVLGRLLALVDQAID